MGLFNYFSKKSRNDRIVKKFYKILDDSKNQMILGERFETVSKEYFSLKSEIEKKSSEKYAKDNTPLIILLFILQQKLQIKKQKLQIKKRILQL
jgi:hypothetical protein